MDSAVWCKMAMPDSQRYPYKSFVWSSTKKLAHLYCKENIQETSTLDTFKSRKTTISSTLLIKGTVVNRVRPSLHCGSLEYTLRVPLNHIIVSIWCFCWWWKLKLWFKIWKLIFFIFFDFVLEGSFFIYFLLRNKT